LIRCQLYFFIDAFSAGCYDDADTARCHTWILMPLADAITLATIIVDIITYYAIAMPFDSLRHY